MKTGYTLRDMLSLRVPGQADIFQRWHLARDDWDATNVFERLERTWQGWSAERRLLLLHTAEQIAHAQQAELAWNPKNRDTSRRYTQLAKEGLQAARLVESIVDRCPPPWDEGQEAIRELVTQLVDFVLCSLDETSQKDHYIAVHVAVLMLDELRSPADSRPALELIAQLVWLAGGKRGEPVDKSVIHRLSTRKLTKTPAGRAWKKSWGLVRKISRLVPPSSRRGAFTDDMRHFLAKPGPVPSQNSS